jgi:hypothetical protein
MPQGDRTGPLGKGPRTGRQMGNCDGARPLALGRRTGLQNGSRGFGVRQRGWRAFCPRWGFLSRDESSEKQALQDELDELELEKNEIEKRLKELK